MGLTGSWRSTSTTPLLFLSINELAVAQTFILIVPTTVSLWRSITFYRDESCPVALFAQVPAEPLFNLAPQGQLNFQPDGQHDAIKYEPLALLVIILRLQPLSDMWSNTTLDSARSHCRVSCIQTEE